MARRLISYRETLVVSSGNNMQNASFNVTAGGTYNNHCVTKGSKCEGQWFL
jgi:hypothetical protein